MARSVPRAAMPAQGKERTRMEPLQANFIWGKESERWETYAQWSCSMLLDIS